MRELFEYAKELATSTRFEESDLLNAIATLRELDMPEASIKLLIERSHAIMIPIRLSELVNIIWHGEIKQLQQLRFKQLYELL